MAVLSMSPAAGKQVTDEEVEDMLESDDVTFTQDVSSSVFFYLLPVQVQWSSRLHSHSATEEDTPALYTYMAGVECYPPNSCFPSCLVDPD